MSDVPIACSLTIAETGDRLAEWRAFLSDQVIGADRGDATLRLRLRDGDTALLTAADLSAREHACCPFFAFSIDIDAEARWLRIAVPPDAIEVLEGLIQLFG